ncbi:Hypothetical predicted protein [Marmota monax]|uniref:Uncharacterized protein n=1 Tax=Marmota monax TaxID=9995 RepID=A0A5E4AP61_MARMO|nr:Hypothetical predicted protein [Marmota monax]
MPFLSLQPASHPPDGPGSTLSLSLPMSLEGGPQQFSGNEQILRLIFYPQIYLAVGHQPEAGGGRTQPWPCSVPFPNPSTRLLGVWGGRDIRTSRKTKVSSRKQGIQGALDEKNSTLGSEAKNRPLKYLIAFPP